MKTRKTLFQKETWIKGMLGVAAFALIFTFNVFVSEAAEGKVIADTVKIRAEASTDSEVVGSTVKGKTVDIVGAVKDASGTVWYKVPIGNNTYGYIRSDLMETSDEIKIESSSSGSSQNTNETKPADTVPTAIGETPATVSQDSIRVRTGASTSHDAVTSLTRGTAITLIGEATDSAGNKWYQITCDKNGRTIKGYVRSDLITVGESSQGSGEGNGEGDGSNTEGNSEGEEGTNAEGGENTDNQENVSEPEPAQPEHNDYEIVYNDETYWLYDNTNGTMMSVSNLLGVVNQVNENNTSLQEQVKNEKIVIIILAVIIVILVVALTILLLKLKDAYYYEEYEDEEEEIVEKEPAGPKKKEKAVVEEVKVSQEKPERPVKKKAVQLQDAELQAAEAKTPEIRKPKRKAQNFLVDDDEFEFEFLNMDDKDL